MQTKAKWVIGIAVIAIVVIGATAFAKSNLFQGSFLNTSKTTPSTGFSEIKLVENNFVRERKGMGTYTFYKTDVQCPSEYKIISGHCDPQHNLFMFPSHYLLDTNKNEFKCEFVSKDVSDATIAARAVCVK